MLVGVFSPLAKMFVPYHEKFVDGKAVVVTLAEVQDNPEMLFSEDKFAITIPRAVGDQRFVFGQPRFLKEQDLIGWLTGGEDGEHCKETDWSGCVQLSLAPDAMGEMMAAIASGEKSSGVDGDLAKATHKARSLSHERCMRQVRFVWGNYLSQVQLNKEQNLGEPRFSPTEYLVSKVLSQELKGTQSREAARRREMDELTQSLTEGTKTHGPRA